MELQHFTVIAGDGDGLNAGDVFTIEGVFNPSSMTRSERRQVRVASIRRWLAHLPERLHWRLYEAALRVAEALEPGMDDD